MLEARGPYRRERGSEAALKVLGQRLGGQRRLQTRYDDLGEQRLLRREVTVGGSTRDARRVCHLGDRRRSAIAHQLSSSVYHRSPSATPDITEIPLFFLLTGSVHKSSIRPCQIETGISNSGGGGHHRRREEEDRHENQHSSRHA